MVGTGGIGRPSSSRSLPPSCPCRSPGSSWTARPWRTARRDAGLQCAPRPLWRATACLYAFDLLQAAATTSAGLSWSSAGPCSGSTLKRRAGDHLQRPHGRRARRGDVPPRLRLGLEGIVRSARRAGTVGPVASGGRSRTRPMSGGGLRNVRLPGASAFACEACAAYHETFSRPSSPA